MLGSCPLSRPRQRVTEADMRGRHAIQGWTPGLKPAKVPAVCVEMAPAMQQLPLKESQG